MALTTPIQVHRYPQSQYIDALRWLPRLSAFHRHIILAAFDSDASSSSLQLLSLSQSPPSDSDPEIPELSVESSLSTPSRISALKTCRTSNKPLIAAASSSGSLSILSADLMNGSLNVEASVTERGFHFGPILGIDVSENGSEAVSVGEDGRVNWINIGRSIGKTVNFQKVFDNNGLVSYQAVKWASPVEFVTGGLGYSLQWWDRRSPGGPVSQFKGNWNRGIMSGIVHSIDIQPSRKHTCLAGGSSGTVFVWDLRKPQQSIVLSGAGTSGSAVQTLSESEVWEVQYDNYSHSSSIAHTSASSFLPAMICSEDGILGVIEQGEEPIELLAEPCAINSFDIDKQNPSDVICSLEWESVAILTRP
ncbi:nuclear pore complex protein NUP43 [Ipomoea triloba]|uniref:nuclear pore complex protein NUP43 n=1 Tax=Ipomoea triloba TaxID=35885 RepID=UPI00125E252F|nr:nuclear pore complex protein NUP43 [Ipomoea triloba]